MLIAGWVVLRFVAAFHLNFMQLLIHGSPVPAALSPVLLAGAGARAHCQRPRTHRRFAHAPPTQSKPAVSAQQGEGGGAPEQRVVAHAGGGGGVLPQQQEQEQQRKQNKKQWPPSYAHYP